MKANFSKILKLLLIPFFVLIGLRTCYYGSPFRSCEYTEKEIPLSPLFVNSKMYSIKAVNVQGTDTIYQCLNYLGSISNRITDTAGARIDANYTINPKIIELYPNSNIEFMPIKLIAVTKHGLSTIDSGPGPIEFLILTDQQGKVYKIATVDMKLQLQNFKILKIMNADKEIVVTLDTKFSK